MPWLQLKLITSEQYVDAIGDVMLDMGALSVTLMDAKDIPILEPGPGETPLWKDIQMMLLFDAEIETESFLLQWQQHPLATHSQSEQFELIEDKDWEREWMDRFEPMKFGTNLWVCPSWKAVPDENAVNVMLDPGLAFGTGTHATTALCLAWLDSVDLKGKTLIDYGCGSGILAIAALKLGAAKVYAVDIDPQAIIATKENARRNQVLDERLLVDYPYAIKNIVTDIVIANILAGPLIELASDISAHCKTNGLIALSGILDSQAELTRESYLPWFEMAIPIFKQEWSRLTGIKTK